MLCSVCKKNVAVIFINKMSKDGENSGVEGLCLECAKKRGIDPLKGMKNVSKDDLNKISDQFESMINSMNPEMIEKLENMPFSMNLFDKNDENADNIFGDSIETNQNLLTQKNNSKDKSKKELKYLDTFGINLTKKAREGQLDRVIGRDVELQRVIQILNRRGKNNPALIGEPGVGKSAIINALAITIANGNVPAKLVNKEVYLLDMTSLVAGTQFRGQFEARIKGIIDECKDNGNIILAIDEVHNIVGGLEHDNSMSAANMLKPALANGSVQIVGATTLKEYRQYIEKDSALERRFQPVIVDEPNYSQCFEILKGTKEYYEKFHKVQIPDDILKQAVIMSDKYIHDRFLPDKAIDLIDEACSRVNLEDVVLTRIEKLEDQIKNIQNEEKEIEDNIDKKEDSSNSKNNVEVNGISEYEKAARLKEADCRLQSELNELEKRVKPRVLTIDDLAKVVELWTKIPVEKVKKNEAEKLLNLDKNLKKKIIGQNYAINVLSDAIIRKRANIRNIAKPPSFIFVGPTGVGKTALVKALAYELFDNEDAIIRMDMSEYMEANSVSKLIGSPPGYVGYDEAGQLTEKVRRKPYSIILFDEIEKAHQSVYNILLQILDDGKLTDSQGRTVSFKHTIVILTSNLGTNFKSDGYGFSNNKIDEELMKDKIKESLKEFFSPEFLNRVDDIVVFNKLSDQNILDISKIMLSDLQNETRQKNIVFDYTPEVLKFIAQKGYDPKFGARPLKRAIQKYIEDLISIKYIKVNIKENIPFKLDIIDNKIAIV